MFHTVVRQKRASVFWAIREFLNIFLFLVPQGLKCISAPLENRNFRQKRASSRHRVEGRESPEDGRRKTENGKLKTENERQETEDEF
jgi:hypothetical protein